MYGTAPGQLLTRIYMEIKEKYQYLALTNTRAAGKSIAFPVSRSSPGVKSMLYFKRLRQIGTSV